MLISLPHTGLKGIGRKCEKDGHNVDHGHAEINDVAPQVPPFFAQTDPRRSGSKRRIFFSASDSP